MVEGKIRGGSVVIEKVDVFRRTLVGIAPLFGGLMVMWLIVRYLLPKASFLCHAEFTGPEYARGISASRILNQVQNDIFCSKLELPFTIDHLLLTVVSLYLIFSISATMYSSKKDLEAMYYSVPVLFIIVLLLYIVGVQFSFLLDALTYFASGISQLNVVLILSLILNGVFFGGIAVLTKLFLRR